MNRFDSKIALIGAAMAGLVAAPASAEINYYWDISELGLGGPAGTVSNDLSIITDEGGFTAVLLAELSSGSFYNPSSTNVPTGAATDDSYFAGGFNAANSASTPSPIIVGKAVDIGGAGIGGANPNIARLDAQLINATWLPDLDTLGAGNFPTGTVAAPAFGGRFSASGDANGTYSIRLANEAGDVVQVLNGVITDGRFSQVLAGDVNLDGDVDVFQAGGQGDIQIVLDNLGTGDSLLTGDANGDDDVDVFQAGGQGDIQIVLDNLGNTTGTTRSSAASATYDATTGELTFNIFGDVQLVGVESTGNFDTGVTPGNLTLFGGNVDAAPLQFDENSIAFFFGAGQAFDQGSVNIGAVLATGLTEADLAFEYTPVGGTTTQGAVNVIPEPGSIALLGLAGLALVRRRRNAA